MSRLAICHFYKDLNHSTNQAIYFVTQLKYDEKSKFYTNAFVNHSVPNLSLKKYTLYLTTIIIIIGIIVIFNIYFVTLGIANGLDEFIVLVPQFILSDVFLLCHHGSVHIGQKRVFLAPVPLSIFRSNSKFDENSKHLSVKYTRPITTIFSTHHDSVTVVTCAKYRCGRSSIIETKAFWIFIEFRIRSKYA